MLTIDSISIWCNLGCSSEELSLAQKITIDLSLEWKLLPDFLKNNSKENILCYKRIVDDLVNLLESKQFFTIEFMCYSSLLFVINCIVRQYFSDSLSEFKKNLIVYLKIYKEKPSVKNINGDVSFLLSSEDLNINECDASPY